jgi:hypothetical protein
MMFMSPLNLNFYHYLLLVKTFYFCHVHQVMAVLHTYTVKTLI